MKYSTKDDKIKRLESKLRIVKRKYKLLGDITKVKKELSKVRKENRMLENLIDLAQVCEWNLGMTYYDILDGTDNGNDCGGTPDVPFAEWFAKRYNLVEVKK